MSELTDVTRKLVAVFAADVEGYSRLMGADEVGTLKGLTERRAILDKLIGEHRGRIANTAGDSVLAEFGSAVEAVKCAVDEQTALTETETAQAGLGAPHGRLRDAHPCTDWQTPGTRVPTFPARRGRDALHRRRRPYRSICNEVVSRGMLGFRLTGP